MAQYQNSEVHQMPSIKVLSYNNIDIPKPQDYENDQNLPTFKSLQDAPKKKSKPLFKYNNIDNKTREKFIELVLSRQCTIQEAAEKYQIKLSTSKAILKTYREEGRIGKKKTRQRRKLSQLQLQYQKKTDQSIPVDKKLITPSSALQTNIHPVASGLPVMFSPIMTPINPIIDYQYYMAQQNYLANIQRLMMYQQMMPGQFMGLTAPQTTREVTKEN